MKAFLLTINILLITYINAHRSAYEHPLKANKFFYFNLEQDLKPQQCIGTTTIEITNSIHQKPRKKKNQLWSHALALIPKETASMSI